MMVKGFKQSFELALKNNLNNFQLTDKIMYVYTVQFKTKITSNKSVS